MSADKFSTSFTRYSIRRGSTSTGCPINNYQSNAKPTENEVRTSCLNEKYLVKVLHTLLL